MKKLTIFLAIGFLLCAGSVLAAPVAYEGTLFDGVANFGAVSTAGSNSSPESTLSDYWTFFGDFGDTVTITVNRLEAAFDPAMWVFEGTFANTSNFGSSIDGFDDGFLNYADDEIPNPGPFGDPQSIVTLTLPGTGQYTVIVTNFLSGADDGDGLFPYSIVADNVSSQPQQVPEPATMLLLGAGLVGLVGASRKKFKK